MLVNDSSGNIVYCVIPECQFKALVISLSELTTTERRTITKTCVGAELTLLLCVCQIYLMKDVILALLGIEGDARNAVPIHQILAKEIGQVFPVA